MSEKNVTENSLNWQHRAAQLVQQLRHIDEVEEAGTFGNTLGEYIKLRKQAAFTAETVEGLLPAALRFNSEVIALFGLIGGMILRYRAIEKRDALLYPGQLADGVDGLIQGTWPRPADGEAKAREIPDGAFLSPRSILNWHGIDDAKAVDALTARLDRWRKGHPERGNWIENEERGANEAKYTYRYGAVKHIVADFLASDTTSDGRPTKK